MKRLIQNSYLGCSGHSQCFEVAVIILDIFESVWHNSKAHIDQIWRCHIENRLGEFLSVLVNFFYGHVSWQRRKSKTMTMRSRYVSFVCLCLFFLLSFFFRLSFLVACTRLYTPLCRSVGRLVGWSVGWSVRRSVGNAFVFSAFFGQFLHHCSCPIARDWFCRVYGLDCFRRGKGAMAKAQRMLEINCGGGGGGEGEQMRRRKMTRENNEFIILF